MLEKLGQNEAFEYQKLTAEEMAKRGILGRLVGTVADFMNPTRNGRKYTEELWDKVFKDPIVQEKINHKVFIGELGHNPDRTEMDPTKAAIILSEPPKKNTNGQLVTVFDILDTPNGRIVKTLADYGSRLGISSRATGDIVYDDNGEEIVDPNTFELEGWDVVLVPGVESARLQYVNESLGNSKKSLKMALTESLSKASEEDRKIMTETLEKLELNLDESTNTNEQVLIKTHNSPVTSKELGDALDIQEIKFKFADTGVLVTKDDHDAALGILQELEAEADMDESIKKDFKPEGDENIKQEEDEETEAENIGSDDIIKSLQEALKKVAVLEKQLKELKEQVAVKDIKVKDVSEELAKYKDATARLSNVVTENKKLESKITELNEELGSIGSKNSEEVSRLRKTILEGRRALSDSKTTLSEAVGQKDVEVKKLEEELSTQKSGFEVKIANLTEELETLKQNSEKNIGSITESLNKAKKLSEGYKGLANKTMTKYIEFRAEMLGVTVNEVKNRLPESYTVDDVDLVCEDLQSYELNINKLPFNVGRKVKVKVRESHNEGLNINKGVDDEVDESLIALAGLRK